MSPRRGHAGRLRCGYTGRLVLIIMVSLSSLLLVWSAPRAASVALSSKVLLLTVMPRCTIKHGQFFLTKALQSKAHFARLLGWELWPASLPSGDESAAWRWPELVLQVLAMRLPRLAHREQDRVVRLDGSGGDPHACCRLAVGGVDGQRRAPRVRRCRP